MYQRICKISDIPINTGVVALLNDQQVAVFKVKVEVKGVDGEKLFALSNYDPFSLANVLSRGIIGSIKDKVVVASPIYKQHFCLTSGQCIEDDSVCLKTWDVKSEGEDVFLLDSEAAAA